MDAENRFEALESETTALTMHLGAAFGLLLGQLFHADALAESECWEVVSQLEFMTETHRRQPDADMFAVHARAGFDRQVAAAFEHVLARARPGR